MPDHDRPEPHDLADHGLRALRERPAVRDGPAELLLEREEEPGSQRERGEPERRERGELVGPTDRLRADPEERVGGETGEQQSDPDRNRAFGQ